MWKANAEQSSPASRLDLRTMIAALHKWDVKTCGIDPNHHAVSHPAEATLLLTQVTWEEHGESVLGSLPTPLHTLG